MKAEYKDRSASPAVFDYNLNSTAYACRRNTLSRTSAGLLSMQKTGRWMATNDVYPAHIKNPALLAKRRV